MHSSNTESNYGFLQGGGVMGELIRTRDWSASAIGLPAIWPQSLRTTLSILLQARFPMSLYWGPELLFFYNDAYLQNLGRKSNHPNALGLPGAEGRPENWAQIKSFIDNVFSGSGATWNEDQLVSMERNGEWQDVYWTFSFSPISDESDKPIAVLVTGIDTTEKVIGLRDLEERSEQLYLAVEASELATWELDPVKHIFNASPRLRDWFGLPATGPIDYALAVNAVDEADRQRVAQAINRALEYDSGGLYEIEHGITNPVTGEQRFVYAKGLTRFDNQRQAIRFNGTIRDVTENRRSKEALLASEIRFRIMLEQSPVAMLLLRGENLVLETANDAMLRMIQKDKSVIGKPILDIMPEIQAQHAWDIMQRVYKTGEPYFVNELPVELVKDGEPAQCYYTISYVPVKEGDRTVGLLEAVVDITEQITARKAIEESERRFRTLIEVAPAAMALFVGRELLVELPNQSFIDYIGKGPDIAGRPLTEIMPELVTEQSPLLAILNDIFDTGIPFKSPGTLVRVLRDGQLRDHYFNVAYTPLFDESASVYAVLDVAIDVTDAVVAKLATDEAEAVLRSAVELAQLGTWSIDVATNGLTYSPRLIEWFGYDPAAQEYGNVIPILLEEDRERIAAAVARALTPGSDGIYDETYTVLQADTGMRKVIHAHGKVVYDGTGRPVRMNGTAQDITIQRQLQEELEWQVRERTVELGESNEQLVRSNEELAQYAYVASHDLQEPLRKIRTFISMIDRKRTKAEKQILLNKIESSAERMSTLIQGLLDFSRLLKSDTQFSMVDMGTIAASVIGDFELTIEEKKAIVTIGNLPIIEAVALQMNQLFYNLIGNALKFSNPGKTPLINIESRLLTKDEIVYLFPAATTTSEYQQLTISDNGIGFLPEFGEQIFEVFKRLHHHSVYPGSGIGLALCKRIVTNHGGLLDVNSQIGVGSVFRVILPVRRAIS